MVCDRCVSCSNHVLCRCHTKYLYNAIVNHQLLHYYSSFMYFYVPFYAFFVFNAVLTYQYYRPLYRYLGMALYIYLSLMDYSCSVLFRVLSAPHHKYHEIHEITKMARISGNGTNRLGMSLDVLDRLGSGVVARSGPVTWIVSGPGSCRFRRCHEMLQSVTPKIMTSGVAILEPRGNHTERWGEVSFGGLHM